MTAPIEMADFAATVRRPPFLTAAAVKPCCGEVLANEECDCAELLAQLAAAPVIRIDRRRRAA